MRRYTAPLAAGRQLWQRCRTRGSRSRPPDQSTYRSLYGIEEAALESQYYMTVANLRAPNTYAIREAISRLVDQGVEGVVVLAPLVSVTETLTDLAEDLPVVAVEGAADPSISVVTVDPCAGALSATQYLLDHGRHNVWHVAGPTDWLESAPRTQGWLDGLACRGIEAPPPVARRLESAIGL